MSKFPTIRHLNDLLPYIQGNPQFRVASDENDFTVVCYMLQDEDTFRGEHPEMYRECRGITFDPAGFIASRTLHKFQNVGENEETQPSMIPWDKIDRIMDKRDGSMITPVHMTDGSIKCKTKKTFTSNEAIAATEFLNKSAENVEWVISILKAGFTPTFEWTSPRFPIVLTYDKDELTLLQIRENSSGKYISNLGDGGRYTRDCPFPIVENLMNKFEDPRELLELAKTETGIEGWIIQAEDGQMWKIKTKWYCDLHHAVTFTRWRDVARSVLDEQSDDLKAAFSMTGRDTSAIVQVENQIHNQIAKVQLLVEEFAGNGKLLNQTAKDMALAHKGREHFGLIMNLFNGKQINWYDWYKKNYLDKWSLEVIPLENPVLPALES
jgi:RNA ligase